MNKTAVRHHSVTPSLTSSPSPSLTSSPSLTPSPLSQTLSLTLSLSLSLSLFALGCGDASATLDDTPAGGETAGLGAPVDLRSIYPLPFGRDFVFTHYDANDVPKGLEEHYSNSAWPDGITFTIHHRFAAPGTAPTGCMRMDDVFRWQGNQLLYLDTYDFYSGIQTSLRSPGHVWADAQMTPGALTSVDTVTVATRFDATGCRIGATLSQISQSTNRAWKAIFTGRSTWAPYTDRRLGGQRVPVTVLQLDETSLIEKNPNDFFKEEWFFYFDPNLNRFVPLASKGYRGTPGGPTQMLWNVRLDRVL